ncbi:hypothetical protein CHS0354_035092 [Potamilus streckersoni]|uniref:Uncharacterized protein n=1 Tax=Potamilus streckersoni TaxID=2493646 RepID=A0AAE0S6T4_9BIVA|nr:hypothetical protein CHS0354_035092 [Potamilus streckersoni]
MDSILTYFSICCCVVMSTDGVTLILEMKSILPLKGSSLELSCRISEPFNSNGIVVWKGASRVTLCYGDSYLCDFYKIGYSFSTNSAGVYGIISSLTTDDEGAWRCSYVRTSGGDTYSNSLNLIVYTIPSGLSITQDPNQNVDLSVQSVVLQCKTTGCTYPMPTVGWIFQNQATSQESVYSTNNPTGMQENCVTQEKIYTSTLNLTLYTTLNDNTDKTGTFACRIEYPDSSRNINAYASNTVRFSVRVKEAVLQQNNQNITEILTVTSSEPVTLTCVTGSCRPSSTIDWYIGFQKRGSGPSLTITFSNMDHNETIYCQAYNTDPSKLVSSSKPRLFVQVRVTEVVLQQNNQNITEILTVTSAEPVTLTCVTGTSRPAPTINWYVGFQKRGSGPSLTITFSNMDHNEMIYCQAYNTDSSRPVLSAKSRLFLRAAPKILDVSPDYKGYFGKYIMIQFDFYSNTKENLTVTARHSNSNGLISQGIIRPTLPDDLGDSPPVPAPDFRAILIISLSSKNDFGQYDLEVKNSIGSDSKSVRIIEQITPEKPLNFHATSIQERQLSLTWLSGYHGGFNQTFVVEISLDNITWNNVSQVNAGNRNGWYSATLLDLIPGSEYYLRLYAYNINGRGDFADIQPIIRMFKECACASSLEVSASVGISVGGAVGVGVGGIVLGIIGIIIAFAIRRQLHGPKNPCFRSKGKTVDEIHTYSNTEMNPQTVKPIYEELNKGDTERSVYDKISPL